ncbi:MAG: Formate--tetrahydrofolate ligase [Planctomycetes bacterium]|nr:Formate--tetrahydrofolate ligase [Planctomycetota bacterium]
MKDDLAIARQAKLIPIAELGRKLGIHEEELIPYGRTKAKVDLSILDRLPEKRDSKYIVITAVTPTPLGEGKTVNTIGTGLGLNRIGKKTITCIRQPSMGPVFGIKGGAAGGGWSQVVPMEDFNLHLTGDMHAVGAAHNLLAAWVDASLMHGNPYRLDPARIELRRVVDVSDRALRDITVGNGEKAPGFPRRTGFDITPASEVMACLALSNDLPDLRRRLGKIIVGPDLDGNPVTAEQMGAAGAMAVVMRDAVMPTLMQTIEGTGCFVHAGPFANIAVGNSSIIADRIALRLADYVVTESGFGADMGCEKFFDIKCRVSGLRPHAAGVVATLRALKMHGSDAEVKLGKDLPPSLVEENQAALERGFENLRKHIENVKSFGVQVVVIVNCFPGDSEREVQWVREQAVKAGAFRAEVSLAFAKGGAGMEDVARALVAACDAAGDFRFCYPDSMSIREKIETLATKLYGADGVDYEPAAVEAIDRFTRWGFGHLPICMAKTQLSISHDPALRARPSGYRFPVRDVRLSAGAGFLYPLAGTMMTMPGLPKKPGLLGMDLDENGLAAGLF